MTRDEFLNTVRGMVLQADVFESARVVEGRLECEARGSAAPAFYRLEVDGGRVWVSLVTPDRWLSESIEADLMHTGDKLEELLEEELVDLGYDGPTPTYEHFRSEDKQFTFRTALPGSAESFDAAGADRARLMLLGYEACFRQLGDMAEDEE
jgi:hypothetical protein